MNLLESIKLAKLAAKDITNLKFVSNDGIVTVTGFSRAFSITAQAECASELNCTADASKILAAVQKFGDSIEQVDGQLKLKQGRSRATIPVMSDNFPEQPRQSDDAIAVSGDIVNMIERVAFAAAKDDVRAVMNGVYVEVKDGKAYAVATNGQRLAWLEKDIESDAETSFILSQNAISPLIAVNPETIEFGYVAKGIGQEAEISIVPVDGKYVPWRNVIPKQSHSIRVAREDALDALQKISVVSTDRLQKGIITFGNSEIVLNSNLQDGSEAEAGFDADVIAEMEIGINVKYLAEAVSAMKGDDVTISYTDNWTAIHFTDGELNVIVMPVVM